jgi:hypothetical protein
LRGQVVVFVRVCVLAPGLFSVIGAFVLRARPYLQLLRILCWFMSHFLFMSLLVGAGFDILLSVLMPATRASLLGCDLRTTPCTFSELSSHR